MMVDNVSWLPEAISLLGRDVEHGFLRVSGDIFPLPARVFFSFRFLNFLRKLTVKGNIFTKGKHMMDNFR